MKNQIEQFLNDKEVVNMSSYKTDAKTQKPVMYLQDTKTALWKKFSEIYPNGMKRTSFMGQLQGGRYRYQEDLGGLCNTCNNYEYLVFGDIRLLISAHIIDKSFQASIIINFIYNKILV